MRILEKCFLLLFRELIPDRDVQATHDFLHRMQGELAAFAGLLHLLVIELLRRSFHQGMIAQTPLGHELVQRLHAVISVAGSIVHALGVAGMSEKTNRKIGKMHSSLVVSHLIQHALF